MACRALGVSRSWYYKWASGRLPPAAERREQLAVEVKRLFTLHEAKYGSPRIIADLRDAGRQVSENTVVALMRAHGLAARCSRASADQGSAVRVALRCRITQPVA